MEQRYIENLEGSPLRKFVAMLSMERKDILLVYIYAILNGIMSLSLPLAIQAIMPLLTAAIISTSLIVLVIMVLVGILTSSGLQYMQYKIIETLQQRIFTRASFEFANRIPRMKIESMIKEYSPELMNRFFDIMTIQKGLPKLIIDLTSTMLQIIFGLLLLAFYHPFFAFYGLLVVGIIVVLFWFTSEKGLNTSLFESKYKYKVAHWLEELSRSMNIFKLAGYTEMPLRHTDKMVSQYLTHRKNHFKVLMSQYSFIVLFKFLIAGGLLTIGIALIVNQEINLGQFVAAEIIIILILSASEKLFTAIETMYDVLTGVEKISAVTQKEAETEEGLAFEEIDCYEGIELEFKDVSYKFKTNKHNAVDHLNLKINAGEKVCIAGYAASGCSTLINLSASLFHEYDGTILVNGVSMRNINLISLRSYVGENLNQNEIMNGTIAENISMGRDDIKYQDVLEASEIVNLKHFVDDFPNGFDTQVIQNDISISFSTATKINLARSIAERPKLFLMDQPLQHLDKKDKVKIAKYLTDKNHDWTLLIASNDLAIASECEKIVVMEGGKVKEIATFEELQKRDYFNDLFES